MHFFGNSKFDEVVVLRIIKLSIYLLLALSGLIAVVVRNLRERKGQSWPVVEGTVESAQMAAVDGQARAEVIYSYSVNGEYYSGVFFRVTRSGRKGEEILAHFPKETRVLVHYDPRSPEVSVLDLNEIKSRLALPGVSV